MDFQLKPVAKKVLQHLEGALATFRLGSLFGQGIAYDFCFDVVSHFVRLDPVGSAGQVLELVAEAVREGYDPPERHARRCKSPIAGGERWLMLRSTGPVQFDRYHIERGLAGLRA